MKLRAALFAALCAAAACIDFDGARTRFCDAARREGATGVCGLGPGPDDGGYRDGGRVRLDAGNGTELDPEPPGDGQLQWGRRFGASGDEVPVAVVLGHDGDLWVGGTFTSRASLGFGEVSSLGGRDLFLARYSASGAPLDQWVARGPGDDQLGGLAMSPDASFLYVGGALSGPLDFGDAGTFDAGGNAREGFVARLGADGRLDAWQQLFSGDGGASRIGRLAVNDDVVIAIGTYDGELTVGGTPLTRRTGEGGFVLIFDPSLQLRSWTAASQGCAVSDFTDVIFGPANTARIFSRMQGDPTCTLIGIGTGMVIFDPTPVVHTLRVSDAGQFNVTNTYFFTGESTGLPVRGAYARAVFVVGVTREDPGKERVATLVFESGGISTSVRALASELGAVAGVADTAYVSFAYRGVENLGIGFGFNGGASLPARVDSSPAFFAIRPGDMAPAWVRALESEGGGSGIARAVALTPARELVVAGAFTGSLGTDQQTLRSDGGADVFLLKFHPPR